MKFTQSRSMVCWILSREYDILPFPNINYFYLCKKCDGTLTRYFKLNALLLNNRRDLTLHIPIEQRKGSQSTNSISHSSGETKVARRRKSTDQQCPKAEHRHHLNIRKPTCSSSHIQHSPSKLSIQGCFCFI